eukprot:scaffold52657_cov20-Prasinocladus_malaysianus.AAC.1
MLNAGTLLNSAQLDKVIRKNARAQTQSPTLCRTAERSTRSALTADIGPGHLCKAADHAIAYLRDN